MKKNILRFPYNILILRNNACTKRLVVERQGVRKYYIAIYGRASLHLRGFRTSRKEALEEAWRLAEVKGLR